MFLKKITPSKDDLKTSNILLKETEDEVPVGLEQKIHSKMAELAALREQPILRVGQNKQEAREKFDDVSNEYNSLVEKFTDFDRQFRLQRDQLETLQGHFTNVVKELDDQKGIAKIFDRALVKETIYNVCPTCTQVVSVDLMSSQNIHVDKLSLEENIAYLEGQRKLIEVSISSLSNVIKEKEVVRKYYLKRKLDFEEEIKFLKQELIADDREYSESDTLKRVRLEKAIDEHRLARDKFIEHLNVLNGLTSRFYTLLADENKLSEGIQEDVTRLEEFEEAYKNAYLFEFGYDSNPKRNISIQQADPFKYFPVFKSYKEDATPQSIRVNSSASDFVRNIWAYTLALMQTGVNHPGIILFDEPGQHRVDSHSLRALFEASANIRDKQVIIFTSVEKELADDDKIDLTELLINLTREVDYYIYELDEVGKCIKLLD